MTAAIAKHVASATVVAILAGGAVARPAMATPAAAGPARTTSLYGNLPASFEANAGQLDRAVEFLCRGAGSSLFLTRGEAVVALGGDGRPDGGVVRMRLAGQARHPAGVGLAPQITRSNYLLGNDPRRWHTGIANYSQVRYPEVYPGIDLLYHGSRRQLELDFVVAPGADPERIRLAFAGTPAIGAVEVGGQGELILRTAHGKLVQSAPVVYQERQGDRLRNSIAGRYVLVAAPAARRGGEPTGVEVGFAVGPYDRSRTLVIDPVQVYSTFLGGNLDDGGNGIAVDGAGNAYVTGQTFSTTIPGVGPGSIQPANGGNIDAFVTKINAAGTAIVYSTFLGGTGGDVGLAIAVDGAGNAYVTGDSFSSTFPGVTAASIQPVNQGAECCGGDAFVAKLNAAGDAMVYATFLGGSGEDRGLGIAVDGAGNAYVTGRTLSATFPGVTASSIQPANAGSIDAYVTKINAAGTAIVYSTFLGGSDLDEGLGIAVDAAGNAYVTGHTFSTTFPGVGAASIQPAEGGFGDAFVTKINAAGTAIVYSTFLGGTGDELGFAIAVDGSGNAYVAGATSLSTTFPGITAGSLQPANGGGFDAFVTKINAAGTAVLYSTFLGGNGDDFGNGIAVDAAGDAFVTGSTASTNFPGVTGSSIQPAYGGDSTDGFVTEIDPAGAAIVFSTYLGGSGRDAANGIALNAVGDVYVTGTTQSAAFPGVSGSSIQPSPGGGGDVFVTKIGAQRSFYTVTPCRVFDTRGGTPLSAGETRVFQVSGLCGIPAGARLVSANLTVVGPRGAGFLTIFPGDAAQSPLTSTLNFGAGQVRANNAVVLLAGDSGGTVKVLAAFASGVTDVLLDVNGYFQ